MSHRLLRVLFGSVCMLLASPLCAEIIELEVTLKSINAEYRSIQVVRNSKTIELDVSKKASVLLGDEESSLEALQAGQEVTVSFETTFEIVTRIVAAQVDPSGDDAAEKALHDRISSLTEEFGAADWRVVDAKRELEFRERLQSLAAEQRERIFRARRLNELAIGLCDAGDYAGAINPFEEAVLIYGEILGESDVEWAKSMKTLGWTHLKLSQHFDAEQCLRRAAEVLQQQLGPTHPDSRQTLRHLADLYQTVASSQEHVDLKIAEYAWQQLAAICRLLHDDSHWQVADARRGLERVQFLLHLSDEQREQLVQAGKLGHELNRFFSEKQLIEASDAAQKIVGIRRAVWGDNHTEVADSIATLAYLLDLAGEPAQAELAYEQSLAVYRAVLGGSHPRYVEHRAAVASCLEHLGSFEKARSMYVEALEQLQQDATVGVWRRKDAALAVERVERLSQLDEDKRQQLATAASLTQTAVQLYHEGHLADAAKAAERAGEIRSAILGDDSIDAAECYNLLGVVHLQSGNFKEAEHVCLRARDIRLKCLGENHPTYATSLNNLAELYRRVGEYERARPLYEKALEISRECSSERPEDLATSLNNLAMLFRDIGQYERAKPLYEEALGLLEVNRELWRPEAYLSDFAQSLNNVAGLYHSMGDLAFAAPLYQQAMEIRASLGEETAEYASSLNNLATLYHERARRGQFDASRYHRAEHLFQEAIRIYESQGSARGAYASTLTNLANLYHDVGSFPEAGKRYEEALKIRQSMFSADHPDVASSMGNLAGHYRSIGRFEDAEQLYHRALEVLGRALGERHPVYGAMLRNLAKLYDSQSGRRPEALPPLRRALEIADETIAQTAAVQSERQQLEMVTMFRSTLDRWLSLSARAEVPEEETYEYVLRWKGAVFARQLEQRKYRRTIADSDDPKLAVMVRDLESTACRIASLALYVPPVGQVRSTQRRLGALTHRKEVLEAALASMSPEFRARPDAAEVTPDRFKELLPDGVVLVDFLEYAHGTPQPNGKGKWETERRLTAFVVRRGQPVLRLDLGPVDPIARAVTAWLGTINRKHPLVGESDPARELKSQIWEPISAQLKLQDHVLVSPDGPLARMPLVALPGNAPNTYLIEERAISILAVPRMLPELLASDPAVESEDVSMLLVGDVDYDADLGGPLQRAEERRLGFLTKPIEPLDETSVEINDIAARFRKFYEQDASELTEDQASESRVRDAATQHRWLHLATHGFFASPDKRSVFEPVQETTHLSGITREAEAFARGGLRLHPGVLSGIVLAGANRPLEDGSNNGILTAMEVTEMDLQNVEVVVLSACDTGLGEVAGGEGVLGIQRAFQMAGAQTVVASLWEVDDKATQQLMSNFYDQLWQRKNVHQLSKLEALRNSQLKLLTEGRKRGFLVDEPETPQDPPRTPPQYWAAFLLSGDWR